MNQFFNGVFNQVATSNVEADKFFLCIFISIILGILLSKAYEVNNRVTATMSITIAMLPAVVAAVIMMVNGNLGAGVAVAGAFSLVRFRSAPGNARDIQAVFLAMAIGLMTGMGYLGLALCFTVIMSFVMIVLTVIGSKKDAHQGKYTLKITVPESLNYYDVFNEVLGKYTKEYELTNVRTSNMGSLYKLTYNLSLKEKNTEKEMMDDLRVRNGNLEISLSNQEVHYEEVL